MAESRAERAKLKAEEMRALLEECERSGLTLTEFGRRRGIALTTLSWWRHRLRAGERGAVKRGSRRRLGSAAVQGARPRAFVEVKLGGTDRLEAPGSASVEVVVRSGEIVRVATGFDAATLGRVLSVLEERRSC